MGGYDQVWPVKTKLIKPCSKGAKPLRLIILNSFDKRLIYKATKDPDFHLICSCLSSAIKMGGYDQIWPVGTKLINLCSKLLTLIILSSLNNRLIYRPYEETRLSSYMIKQSQIWLAWWMWRTRSSLIISNLILGNFVMSSSSRSFLRPVPGHVPETTTSVWRNDDDHRPLHVFIHWQFFQ